MSNKKRFLIVKVPIRLTLICVWIISSVCLLYYTNSILSDYPYSGLFFDLTLLSLVMTGYFSYKGFKYFNK